MKLSFLTTLCLSISLADALDSCVGRCGYGTNPSHPCQCNAACERFRDCCSDYWSTCAAASQDSCQGRCGESYNSSNRCHCNTKCGQYSNCCKDYSTLCGGSSSGGASISDLELQSLSERLLSLDVNKARPGDLTLNPQSLIPDSETASPRDRAPQPLFSFVNEGVLFSKPTFSSFLKLLDNYSRFTGSAESFSSEQQGEQDSFLRAAVMGTALGKELYNFLFTKGYYSSEVEFIQDLKMMWFGLYSRGKGQLDSSGFEHIFLGEIKNSKVSGFHNWIQFYLLEKQGQLNYYSHSFDGPWTSYPDVLGLQFNWDGYYKQVGSAFIGSSPEFDLAVYSLCFIARPGKACQLRLGGKPIAIQTYTWTNSFYGNGKKFIASAYPISP
ncbi:poly(U)-specific endoribonuclease isoform X1 [Acipenser oxyrinchus oxyrinchus]|uniref:Uridylate-specific endoribonuclease n=1 Tax=Acipenser oxyrinchus oxyrinchus TaxID=40147 RepID=A0AAD8CGU7_ACIOX|nr:poly(U)-specific endoribonuclease isoform X1 [Acipenser oxyrinchus oxyrinchus]